MSRPTTLVIGAGFGGLAAALRALAHGDRVILLERQPEPGGRARQWQRDGFVHDLGPTVLTAPWLFAELFQLFGEELADAVQLQPLQHWYRFRFADGETLEYGADLAAVEDAIARIAPADVAGYRRLLAYSEQLLIKGFDELGAVPFHRPGRLLGALPALARLRCDRSVWQAVCGFLRDDRLRRAFSIQPLLVGGSPLTTTAIYLLIHALERRWGVHFPRGGTGALVRALVELFQRHGGDLRTGVTVTELRTDERRITGAVCSDGQLLSADRVICNADPGHVYARLLPATPGWHRLRRERLRYAMGLFVLHFGTRQRYEAVPHHTIGFGREYVGVLKDIFAGGRLSDDFSYYLHRPTATDPQLAPPGCDTFYVLVPVPNLAAGIDWDSAAAPLAERLLTRLEADLLPDLRQQLTHRFWQTPVDFREDYLSPLGAGFSLQPLFSQSAFFRFHNQSPFYRNLYFVGAGTHPGAGVPGVVSSAKVLEQVVPWQHPAI